MSRARDEVWIGESKYVFSATVRIEHWTIFLSVLVLSVTGYWIGSGNLPLGPNGVFQMGWIRYVHTVTGWVFVAAILARLYCAFFGTEYARWREFIPTKKSDFVAMKDVFLYYAFLRPHYPHLDYGHNRLAAITYVVVYLLLTFMVITGFALHGMAFSVGWQSWMRWPLVIVSAPTLRLAHHMGMWLIWGFAVHHVASAVLVDHESRGGLMGGIFSGYKIVPKRAK